MTNELTEIQLQRRKENKLFYAKHKERLKKINRDAYPKKRDKMLARASERIECIHCHKNLAHGSLKMHLKYGCLVLHPCTECPKLDPKEKINCEFCGRPMIRSSLWIHLRDYCKKKNNE